jgi:hypothetical protein
MIYGIYIAHLGLKRGELDMLGVWKVRRLYKRHLTREWLIMYIKDTRNSKFRNQHSDHCIPHHSRRRNETIRPKYSATYQFFKSVAGDRLCDLEVGQ